MTVRDVEKLLDLAHRYLMSGEAELALQRVREAAVGLEDLVALPRTLSKEGSPGVAGGTRGRP